MQANCPIVNLISNFFETEEDYDYVQIAGSRYDGYDDIDVTIPSSTIVYFHSDSYTTKSGFILKWKCVGKSQSSNSFVILGG